MVFWRDGDEGLEEWWKEPWEINPEWSGGRVVVRSYNLWSELARVVFLNAIFWTLAILMYWQGPQPDVPRLFRIALLLLPAVTLLEAARTFLVGRKLAKREVSVLQIEGGTGVIGGRFQGPFETGVPAHQLAGPTLRVRLTCYHVYPGANPRKSDNRPRPKRIWQEEQEVPWTASTEGVSVPISFSVPESLPESDTDFTGTDYIMWELAASAPAATPAYHVKMRVPVFRRSGKIE